MLCVCVAIHLPEQSPKLQEQFVNYDKTEFCKKRKKTES